MAFLYTKFKTKSELIQEFIIEPIIESNEYLKCAIKDMKVINENNITYEVVRFLKNKSKYQNLYQRQIIKTIVRQKQINLGDINEPDLEILFFYKNSIVFEAKRINKNNTPSTYCGDEGFGRFISGYYEIRNYCGMLGYMETGILTERVKKIKELLFKGEVNKIKDILNNLFLSFHKSNKKIIKGFHLILDLT